MCEELNELGLQVVPRRVGHLMRQNRIQIIRSRKFKRTTDCDHVFYIAPNLLPQDLAASEPNQKWAGDDNQTLAVCLSAIRVDYLSRP